jgi:hypothetical protein
MNAMLFNGIGSDLLTKQGHSFLKLTTRVLPHLSGIALSRSRQNSVSGLFIRESTLNGVVIDILPN